MKLAARISDTHICPIGGSNPHVGGIVISPGCHTVLISGLPAARVSDRCSCLGHPNFIISGSGSVYIGGLPAARMGDKTSHGGVITSGCPNVFIGS